jgi:hypothetical protein
MPWVEKIKALPVDPTTGCRPLPPDVPTLDAELEPIMMHKAQKYGLPADWIAARNRLDPQRRQVLPTSQLCFEDIYVLNVTGIAR